MNATWNLLFLAMWNFQSTGQVVAVSAGIVCAIIAIVLSISSRTKWGQNKPLSKCIALAVLAHVWLLMYAYGTRLTVSGPGSRYGSPNGSLQAKLHPDTVLSELSFDNDSNPLPSFEALPVPTTLPPSLRSDPKEPKGNSDNLHSVEQYSAQENVADVTPSAGDPGSPEAASEEQPGSTDSGSELANRKNDGEPEQATNATAETMKSIDSSSAVPDPSMISQGSIAIDRALTDAKSSVILPDMNVGNPGSQPFAAKVPVQQFPSNRAISRSIGAASVQFEPASRAADQTPVPDVYQLRLSPQRSQMAMLLGGDESTEASVQSALRWLASVQEPDGSWNASKYGAGRETKTLERDRKGQGKIRYGDDCFVGLSIPGGREHAYGRQLPENGRHGLEYLIRSQMPSGDLAGLKQVGTESDVRYARMYCHGMATLALAEAYSMTGDRRLLPAIEKGAGYTLRAQNPHSGGWRYDAFVTGIPVIPVSLDGKPWRCQAAIRVGLCYRTGRDSGCVTIWIR